MFLPILDNNKKETKLKLRYNGYCQFELELIPDIEEDYMDGLTETQRDTKYMINNNIDELQKIYKDMILTNSSEELDELHLKESECKNNIEDIINNIRYVY